MIAVWAVVVVLFGHWLADFVFQPDWMGKGKSKSWLILTHHAVRITAGMTASAAVVAVAQGLHRSVWQLLLFGLVNGYAHFLIDAVTSRMTGRLYAKGDHHNFFTVIGFDQFLHTVIMIYTLTLWVYS